MQSNAQQAKPGYIKDFRGTLTRGKDYECDRCKGFHDDEEKVMYVKLEMK